LILGIYKEIDLSHVNSGDAYDDSSRTSVKEDLGPSNSR